MELSPEKIVIIECEPADRESLLKAVEQAGYTAAIADSMPQGIEMAREMNADLLVVNANLAGAGCREALAEIKGSAATQGIRVILLVGPGVEERTLGLDMGADDALSRPWEKSELLARIRAQLRGKRAVDELREKTTIAEEGQQIAQTAFQALAVTEKMTRDAFTLGRVLKIGVSATFVVAAVMAAVFFLFSHRATKESQRADAIIARLEGGLNRQQDLLAQVRKLHEEEPPGGSSWGTKDDLQRHAVQLKAAMAKADSNQLAALRKELAETDARLRRVEQEGAAAQSIIPADISSVCLIHVSVGFRHEASGQRLRYAGISPQGLPIEDSSGKPILTLEGRGPEVRLDVFGTGFLAGPSGQIVTNRHVAQPWWNDEEMNSLESEGVQPEIATIEAYFPGVPHGFSAKIQKLSDDVDLAAMRVDLGDLARRPLAIDARKEAAASGEPIVLMGYATGIAAILARTDEETAQKLISESDGDASRILDELAQRGLIRPLITQGHVGDVMPDKILFDAQTTSGGSGGPLLNQDGKVIGVTYAVLRGFGGSNFGIPVRFAEPLLGP